MQRTVRKRTARSLHKSMRLAMTVGYRVLVCDNMAFYGDFTPETM